MSTQEIANQRVAELAAITREKKARLLELLLLKRWLNPVAFRAARLTNFGSDRGRLKAKRLKRKEECDDNLWSRRPVQLRPSGKPVNKAKESREVFTCLTKPNPNRATRSSGLVTTTAAQFAESPNWSRKRSGPLQELPSAIGVASKGMTRFAPKNAFGRAIERPNQIRIGIRRRNPILWTCLVTSN